MLKVENTIANQTACLCPVCPVQVDSDCISRKKSEFWVDIRAKVVGGILVDYAEHPETYEMSIDQLRNHPTGKKNEAERITEETMIELYCSIGKSDCSDLLTDRPCICGDCYVWEGHGLRSRYFCLQGRAEEIPGEAK